MASFTTSNGQTWELNLTIADIKRVRNADIDNEGEGPIDLLALDSGSPPLLTRIGIDVALLCDIIYVLVQPQADKAGVSSEDFGSLLGGDTIAAASDAFYEALADFFRRLRRNDLSAALEKQKSLIAESVMEATTQIKDFNVKKALKETLGKQSIGSPGQLG